MQHQFYKNKSEAFKKLYNYIFFEGEKVKDGKIDLIFEQTEGINETGVYQDATYRVFLKEKKVSPGLRLANLFKNASQFFDSGLPTKVRILFDSEELEVKDVFKSSDTITRIFEIGREYYKQMATTFLVNDVSPQEKDKEMKEVTGEDKVFESLLSNLENPKRILHANNTYLVGKLDGNLVGYKKNGTLLKPSSYRKEIFNKYNSIEHG